ncbi:MAG: type II toxin-antitoxin system HicB family antitoxin [Nitrospirae bacterium]|nr:type II toxin-antitoxin system HicB family antitoxin [Nitrospirota bacterium]
MQVVFNIQLPAQVKKEGKWYISSCTILDVYSQGETKVKALDNLIEATRLFLVSCFERGTLGEVLQDCGFKPLSTKGPIKEKPFPKKYESIHVPLPFNLRGSQSHCHV